MFPISFSVGGVMKNGVIYIKSNKIRKLYNMVNWFETQFTIFVFI
jgi:hypothetical protein